METIYTTKIRLRDAQIELFGDQFVQPFERPSRAEHVVARVREQGLGSVS